MAMDPRTARYDQVRFKASHNSYARKEQPVTSQLRFDAASPHQAGCRGLELDLVQSDSAWEWRVAHHGPYQDDRPFSAYLESLRHWSLASSGHDVVTVTLDLKHTALPDEDFPDAIDDYIAAHLGTDRVFSPGRVMEDGETLADGIGRMGWSAVGDMKDCFVLCLSGAKKRKANYAAQNPRVRRCFADVGVRLDNPLPSGLTGNEVFLNIYLRRLPEDIPIEWQERLKRVHEAGVYVSRLYLLNGEPEWKWALDAGVNIMATNKVKGHSWAKVGSEPFAVIS